MKKWITAGMLCAIVLLFSSCTLHLGEQTLQLPWWMITVLSVIPALLVVVVVAYGTLKDNAKAYYVCPHCGHRFVPGWRVVWSMHIGDEFSLKCPHCLKRGMCSMSHDQEN